MNLSDAPYLEFLDGSALAAAAPDFTDAERAFLDRVNTKVAAGQSLEEVMDFLFEASRSVCPCDRIGLSFVEEDGARIVSRWARASYEPILLGKGYAEDLRGSTLEEVLRSGHVRIINDLEAYLVDHPQSRSTRMLIREGVRASMTCPLTVEGRIVGMLFRSSRVAGVYSARQVALHLALAERLGQAVEKAWRIDQLSAANQAYTEMLGFVSHELKSPVASIVTDAQVLSEGYLGDLTPDQKHKIDRMILKGEYLLSLVREYLDLARLEGGELTLNARDGVRVDADLIEPAVDIVRPQIDAKRMRLTTAFGADLPGVTWDVDLMKIVLVNLIGNAVKYGHEAGEIRVTVNPAADASGEMRLALSVWNEGPGFPPSERGRLFRKFSRLQVPELQRQKGTGVGLYTVWRIVRLHGGRITARSEFGSWAEFTAEIPVKAAAPGSEGTH